MWDGQVCAEGDGLAWQSAFEAWQECVIRAVEALRDVPDPDPQLLNEAGMFYRIVLDMPMTAHCLGGLFAMDDERLVSLGKDLRKRWFRLSETNIGEYAILDMLAKQKLLGWTDMDEVIVFVNDRLVVNRPYLEMWAAAMPDYLRIVPYEAEEDVPPELVPDTHSPLTKKYVLPYPHDAADPVYMCKERYYQLVQAHVDVGGLQGLVGQPSIFSLRGYYGNASFDPPDDWGEFVALHVREPGWKHESDVDRHACRNCDVEDYLGAVEEILCRGYKVVRLGHPGMKPLPDMEGVIDLAQAPHDPLLDVVAMAHARFFMGPDSGPGSVAGAFATPSLVTDLYPVTRRPTLPGDLYVPRLVWTDGPYPGPEAWLPGDRYLTAHELFRPPWYDMPVSDPFKGFRCRWIPNTPDELADAARDMLDDVSRETPLQRAWDGHLQDAWDACDDYDNFPFAARMAPSFLRRHADDLGLNAEIREVV